MACAAACTAPVSESVAAGDPLAYSVLYSVTPDPATGHVHITMRVTQDRRLLRELRFGNERRISDIQGDGDLRVDEDQVVWRPDESGGRLRWSVLVNSPRGNNGYDAWLDESWGIMRAEDLIPRASARTLKAARSQTTLLFKLPRGWSVITPYSGEEHRFRINKAGRRFDQPDGWILMGDIGVRRETIAAVRVAVAAPVGHAVRRMDMLALLRWTLPDLDRLLPDLPPRLTIVSAGDPMWRGGLSAPGSLYIHAERPMISENATSTLLHEIMHTTLRLRAADGYDWIVEGLAEYYSLELLRRSGTISERRYKQALGDLATWGKTASTLCRTSSTGATTALAVSVMAALDSEIRKATDGEASLDDVLRRLRQSDQPSNLTLLARTVEQVAGKKSEALDARKLAGCSNMPAVSQEIH